MARNVSFVKGKKNCFANKTVFLFRCPNGEAERVSFSILFTQTIFRERTRRNGKYTVFFVLNKQKVGQRP